ncbi:MULTISPECIES: hypothetical protein [Luteimonas]|uniref:hypothetical protein n=1 Tax=Luteimonas TaxID=83614 RepID=UPI000C7B2123|nr:MULTISPECIES: hypothetical protein [Luteimonas]
MSLHTPMPLGARVVALIALLWNLFGVLMFVLQMSVTPEQAALLPPAQQQINAAMPEWVLGVFGVAVVAGTAGAFGLLIARRWAVPLLLLSLVAVVVQLTASYLLTPVWALTGASGALLPVLLVGVVGAVWLFARAAAGRGWLR